MSDTLAARLDEAIKAVCPIVGVRIGNKADKQTWQFLPDGATAPQIAAAQAVINGFTTTGPLRSLLDIITDLNALTALQKTAVWNDINSGSPPKWALDVGPNAAAIAVLQLFATMGVFSTAQMTDIKIRGVALYVSDNPLYLVHPAFDATIFIPGATSGIMSAPRKMAAVREKPSKTKKPKRVAKK
jgi:hypothetical protein